MRNRFTIQPWVYFLLGIFIFSACRQPEPEQPDPIRRKSPIAIAKTMHDASDTYVKIVYGQPYKRERDIFGNVVPFDEVWRTGANEATELTTTNNIIFGGQELEAGTYTLFSIPRKNENWTIILNSELGQWGAFDYSKSKDVLRIEAPSMNKEAVTEAFTIQFSEIENDSTNIIMRWDQQVIRIPVEFISTPNISS